MGALIVFNGDYAPKLWCQLGVYDCGNPLVHNVRSKGLAFCRLTEQVVLYKFILWVYGLRFAWM